jgi:hypothetical protein
MNDARQDIVNWAKYFVTNKAKGMHYAEVRPMPLTSKFPITTDCSGFVTLCYYLAGAADPNGLGYSHYGYTGTLLSHGTKISPSMVQPGDVIVYGPGTGWHTAVIVEAGKDPMTISMGQEGDPSYVKVSQDGRLPQTYLRFRTKRVHPLIKFVRLVKTTIKPKKAPLQTHAPLGVSTIGDVPSLKVKP